MKLAIIVGTRPEIIRLSATINLARKLFDTKLIHTGQNYDKELYDVFLEELDIAPPDYYLDCSRKNIGATVGDIIAKTYDLFVEISPDAILILGDTNSCMCAYSAKRLKIPIFHLEAGNRCHDPNVPEEINRRLIDHISDINVCYMEHARRNLLQENLKSQYVFVVGSPMQEVLKNIKNKINDSKIIDEMGLISDNYILLSTHREENINNESNFKKITQSVQLLHDTYKMPVIVSTHPRTRKMIEEKGVTFTGNIVLCKPFGIIDYCKLQKDAFCVVSDSGTLTEESSMLHFPAVLLRTSTEHPEGVDAGNIVIGNITWDSLKISIELATSILFKNKVSDYEDSNFSEKVCNIIAGYKDIVNKFIWMKNL